MSESASTSPSSKFTSASPVIHGERINSIEIMGGVEGLDLLPQVSTHMYFEGIMRGMF